MPEQVFSNPATSFGLQHPVTHDGKVRPMQQQLRSASRALTPPLRLVRRAIGISWPPPRWPLL